MSVCHGGPKIHNYCFVLVINYNIRVVLNKHRYKLSLEPTSLTKTENKVISLTTGWTLNWLNKQLCRDWKLLHTRRGLLYHTTHRQHNMLKRITTYNMSSKNILQKPIDLQECLFEVTTPFWKGPRERCYPPYSQAF